MPKIYQSRPLDGILLLDKPFNLSSGAAVDRAKHLFQAQKVGHTGSLDQLATGLLPLCFGKATKIAGYLLDADKCYEAVCQFGQISDTGDREGHLTEINKAKALALTQNDIEQILPQFLGKQLQIPPMHAAIKYQGKRLYKLARAGEEIQRKPREIQIFSLKILGFSAPMLRLEVRCSKGTYIRSLVADLGSALDCGAVLQDLRRTAVGDYTQMLSFATLEQALAQGKNVLDSHLLGIDSALVAYPQQALSEIEVQRLQVGKAVHSRDFTAGACICLIDSRKTWCGFARIDENQRLRPIVFMREQA